MSQPISRPIHLIYLALIFLTVLPSSTAYLFSPSISTCRTTDPSVNASRLININQAWAQIIQPDQAAELGLIDAESGKRVLRVNLIGDVGSQIDGFSNDTGKLATLFQTTSDITYTVWSTATYLCNSLFPASPLPYPYVPRNTTYCPLAPGPLAINISIPLSSNYAVSTLSNEFRIVDASVPPVELACISFDLSPYDPNDWYWSLILWLPAGLAIGYWISSWAGRFAAGWVVGRGGEGAEDDVDVRVGLAQGGRPEGRKWGTMIISGLSGERLGVSGGLLRFITPGFRDLIWHLQFIGVLGMTAVNWPDFAYPVFAQAGWASLVGNVTLVQGDDAELKHRNLLSHRQSTIPTDFADQINSTASPLYLDDSLPNMFMSLGNSDNGLESFATAIGLRSRDMYGTCVAIFLAIAAGIIGLSLLIWVGHAIIDTLFFGGKKTHSPTQSAHLQSSHMLPATVSSRKSTSGKHTSSDSYNGSDYELALAAKGGMDSVPPTPGTSVPLMFGAGIASSAPGGTARQTRWKKGWAKFKIKGPIGAFHYAALCGNLVRILILFHLPLTLFSVYQWTIRDVASLASVILSALSFAVFSVLLPIYLLIQVSTTPTAKLYDAMRTLLSLGPLYNIYAQGNQLYQALRFTASLATGIAIGAGQNNGTAQAIVLLVIEIAFGLLTTVWQPWRPGAGMVVPGFLFTILRIVSTVLLVILSPAVNIGTAVAGWITYSILVIQGIVLLAFLIMLISKVLEGLIRLFGNVAFADSTHALDGGLFAAFGGLSSQSDRRKKRKAGKGTSTKRSSTAGSVNTQMMLDRFSTNTTAGPMSPTGHNRGPSAGYFPPQNPNNGSWGGIQSPNTGYAPINVFGHDGLEEELLQDENPPVRGFSVLRGGKADYKDPYSALPGTERQAVSKPRSDFGTPGQHTAIMGTVPLASAEAPRPVKHARTKSQTAVIESLPSSLSNSPHATTYPPLSTSGGNSPSWTPAPGTPSSEAFAALYNPAYGRQPLSPTSQQVANQLEGARPTSPGSEGSSDEAGPSSRKSRPSSWFGLGGKRKPVETDSEDEEELDDFGPSVKGKNRAESERQRKSQTGGSSSGGWFSSLGLSSDKKARQSTDENQVNENGSRKSAALVDATETGYIKPGGPVSPAARSFKVIRNNSKSTTRSMPLHSDVTTPPLPDLPAQRGFVVVRASRSGQSSANPSQPTSPVGAPASIVETAESNGGMQESGKSFVVNRQNRSGGGLGLSPGPSVSFAPETYQAFSRSPQGDGYSEFPTRPPRDPRRSMDE